CESARSPLCYLEGMGMFAPSPRRVAVVAGLRTPFLRSGTDFKDMTAVELGTVAVREVVARADVDPKAIDLVVLGPVTTSTAQPSTVREVVFGPGLPMAVSAYSVVRACAPSNLAVTDAAEKIALGVADIVVAGGSESLSDIPILVGKKMRDRLLA